MRVRVLTLLFLTLSAAAAFAEDAPKDHVSIDVHRANWEPMVLATSTAIPEPPADNVSIDLTKENPIFTSKEPGANGVVEYRFHAPIGHDRYPFLVVKYRAKNLNTAHNHPGIWIDDVAGKGAIKAVANLDEFKSDGEVQELRKDLRTLEPPPRQTIGRILFGIMATEQGEASFELIGIDFEADPAAAPVEAKEDSALTIAVFTADATPIKGAKVIVDAERKNVAKPGESDENGEVKLTPMENETGVHAVQIEAEGMATYFATLPKGSPGATVHMTPGVSYGGIVKNEDGQPVAGATVRIFAPPPPEAPQPTDSRSLRRAVMKTDAEGKWRSPLLPEGAPQVITKIAHPDYIPDKEYRGAQDEPPLEEMKAGTGVMVLKK